MPLASSVDLARMRDQLFFEGPDLGRRLTRFWLLLVLAAVIASAGVVEDSVATVIGAMIVAPLMVPILGTVLAVQLTDRANLLRCIGLVAAGAASVVLVAYLLGLVVHEPVVAATNAQAATWVSPRLIDLIAALATGAVGSIALARDDVSDTLPGVAIAISLVPPLATAGLTLEAGDGEDALGALLMFTTNVSAILATGLLVMTVYGVSRRHRNSPRSGARPINRSRAVAVIVAGLAVISVPLTLTSVRIASSDSDEATVSDLATAWADGNDWEIAGVTTSPEGILVRATGPLPEPEIDSFQQSVTEADLDGRAVSIELIPSRRVSLSPG